MAGSQSGRLGELLFQPLHLHLEPSDLLEQIGGVRLGWPPGGLAALSEQGGSASEQRLLPAGDEDGVDTVPGGQLVGRLLPRRAARATWALIEAVYTFRGRAFCFSPSRATTMAYAVVQFSGPTISAAVISWAPVASGWVAWP